MNFCTGILAELAAHGVALWEEDGAMERENNGRAGRRASVHLQIRRVNLNGNGRSESGVSVSSNRRAVSLFPANVLEF